MAITVPIPRAPRPGPPGGIAEWYENELGWATAQAPGDSPVQLVTGLRFDVLELPADAGHAVLRRCGGTGPVALMGQRMRILLAAGSADEVPGLLEWLEWGGVALDLTAVGAGGRITAPVPPAPADRPAGGPAGAQGTARWLRPPEPRREVEPVLPAFTGFARAGAGGSRASGAPDLVRLVDAAATECHRVRLTRGARRGAQPLAFS
ncbi:SCO3374 family protein [Streptomyces sp. NPDC050504]|uniref:SCO3374 family protein n=1 Tax=Streptomyces sp. NPDC050504 TaxID=3365618 RepID=UPI0037A2534B